MNPKLIGVVYFYVVSLISLFLIVGGIFSSVQTGLKIALYDRYPGRFAPPMDVCRTPPFPAVYKVAPPEVPVSTPSAEELEKWKAECEKDADIQAKSQKVEDITRSAVMLVVGASLFAYHFPKARKSST